MRRHDLDMRLANELKHKLLLPKISVVKNSLCVNNTESNIKKNWTKIQFSRGTLKTSSKMLHLANSEFRK